MKKFYDFVESNPFAICIWFGVCAYLPPVLQKNYGHEVAIAYSALLLLTGVVGLGLLLLWMMRGFVVRNPGYLVAVGVASFIGVMIGGSALYGILGGDPFFYLLFRGVPFWLFISIMLVSLFLAALQHTPQRK